MNCTTITRSLTETTKKEVAGYQRYKCANKKGSNVVKDYDCPLWNKDDCGGDFDESGYNIDHIKEFCISHDDSRGNLQALCKDCHREKTRQFMTN